MENATDSSIVFPVIIDFSTFVGFDMVAICSFVSSFIISLYFVVVVCQYKTLSSKRTQFLLSVGNFFRSPFIIRLGKSDGIIETAIC